MFRILKIVFEQGNEELLTGIPKKTHKPNRETHKPYSHQGSNYL